MMYKMLSVLSRALLGIYIFSSAGSQITEQVIISKIRWIGASAAGHQLILSESTVGNTGTQVLKMQAAGENYIEESSALMDVRLPRGIRVHTIDSGQVWIYTKDQ